MCLNEKFIEEIHLFAYIQSQSDTMFFQHSKGGKVNDDDEIRKLKRMLANEFEIKYFEKLRYFLGIEFASSRNGMFLSRRKCLIAP